MGITGAPYCAGQSIAPKDVSCANGDISSSLDEKRNYFGISSICGSHQCWLSVRHE